VQRRPLCQTSPSRGSLHMLHITRHLLQSVVV
jgi:hypothetical protein